MATPPGPAREAAARSGPRSSPAPRRPPPSRRPAPAGGSPAGTGAARPSPRRGRRRSGSGDARRPPALGRATRVRPRRRRQARRARTGPGKKRSISSSVAPQLEVRASRRPRKISTSGRATWVERIRSEGSWKLPTLSERECRSAAEATLGRERVVDVDEVEVDSAQQPLERPADVERQRRGPRSRPAGQRDPGAEREHARGAAPEQRRRPLLGLGDRPPRLADLAARARGGGDHDPVAALGELGRDPGGELVDLVARPPGVRRHLDDRETVARGHRRRIRAGPSPPGAPPCRRAAPDGARATRRSPSPARPAARSTPAPPPGR